jgi:integrase
VLYQECIPRPWARSWPLRVQAMETGRGLSHGESFRDEISSSEVDTRHQAVLSRLRTEIRARHYSLRTERAYEHWIRRFVTFHSLKSPQHLGGEPLGTIGDFTRAKRPRRHPVVPTREEVKRLLDALSSTSRLMAGLLYGSGIRLRSVCACG